MEPEEGNERARGKYRMPDLRGKGFRGLFDSGKYLPGLAEGGAAAFGFEGNRGRASSLGSN